MDQEKAVAPFCKHFNRCGGCSFQDAPYETQLSRKQEAIEAALEATGFDASRIVKRIIPSQKTTGYRNRMDFVSFSDPHGKNGLGLRERGSWKKCIDLEECRLIEGWQNEARTIVKEWQARNKIPPWDPYSHTGVLRYAVCRDSSDGKSKMLSIICAKGKEALDGIDGLYSRLRSIGVTSFFVQKNEGWSDVSNGEPQLFDGEGFVTETIEGIPYRYGPLCFFQPNPSVGREMVKTVKDALRESGSENVLDLYCGVGLFTLAAAGSVKKSTGVEIVGESVEFAKQNAELNRIENVSFIANPAEKNVGREFIDRFDTVIVDPPRSGLHANVLAAIAGAKQIKTIIYSSCNPAKFVNDAASLSLNFQLKSVQPLDMFPHTPHFEAIGVFTRK